MYDFSTLTFIRKKTHNIKNSFSHGSFQWTRWKNRTVDLCYFRIQEEMLYYEFEAEFFIHWQVYIMK